MVQIIIVKFTEPFNIRAEKSALLVQIVTLCCSMGLYNVRANMPTYHQHITNSLSHDPANFHPG